MLGGQKPLMVVDCSFHSPDRTPKRRWSCDLLKVVVMVAVTGTWSVIHGMITWYGRTTASLHVEILPPTHRDKRQ